MNKVLISLVVILFAFSGVLGYFTFSLNGQVNTVKDDIQAFESDTVGRLGSVESDIASVDANFNALEIETAEQFTGVDNEITGIKSDITGVRSNVTGLSTDLSAFKSDTTLELNSAQASINGLNSNLAELSQATMNIRRVYDDVIGSVCQIIGDIGTGSGFIYSDEGYIVTCWHVTDGQSYLDVILHDGTFARATLVGSDKYSDVAVLKIPGNTNFIPLELADSGSLVVGEPVIVVGNPLGIFESATYGVISRTNYRELFPGESWRIANLIQYDAPTNRGNSGGPVFNNQGQVIGIASWGYDVNDMNYAVSSNKIKRVADAIINNGPFTNVTLPGDWWIDDLTPELARERGLNTTFGMLFYEATDVGQLQADDVIIVCDGIIIQERADFFSYIEEFKSPGDTITLTVMRAGVEKEVTVTLKAWD